MYACQGSQLSADSIGEYELFLQVTVSSPALLMNTDLVAQIPPYPAQGPHGKQ